MLGALGERRLRGSRIASGQSSRFAAGTAANIASQAETSWAAPGLPPSASTTVSASTATAPRFSAGSRTNTSSPGAELVLVAVDREERPAAQDEVDLLVPELALGVGLDDRRAGLERGVRVHPERADVEAAPDRPPDEAVGHLDAVELVDVRPRSSRRAPRNAGRRAARRGRRPRRRTRPRRGSCAIGARAGARALRRSRPRAPRSTQRCTGPARRPARARAPPPSSRVHARSRRPAAARTRRRSPPSPDGVNALPASAPHGEHDRPRLDGRRRAERAGRRVHERARRRVERLLAQREARRAAHDDVQLFRAALLAVRLDHLVAGLLAFPGVERRTAGSRAAAAAAAGGASRPSSAARSRSSSPRIS